MILQNSYLSLGEHFYQAIKPVPVASPKILLWNRPLAQQLGLEHEYSDHLEKLTGLFSGNHIPDGIQTLALAYSGHQFGQFSPSLGDGRAHLLGEWFARRWHRLVDLQLKGSGPTQFSRGGDGRCALGPALREYMMSEAMSALGVPSTRVLAVVTTGESVVRNSIEEGAIVVRVASSHIRVGSFEYFYSRNDVESVQRLADFAIRRHFDHLLVLDGEERYEAFLQEACDRQIQLICEWMRVGFIHGVMNTDNTAISGETIDFGPCAMMNSYNPDTVFSSIDMNGRYRFGYQPVIGQWNMARLAESLLPLLGSETAVAVRKAEDQLTRYSSMFESSFNSMMANKMGIAKAIDGQADLRIKLLEIMRENALDYTNTFMYLSKILESKLKAEHVEKDVSEIQVLKDWCSMWLNQVPDIDEGHSAMRRANPLVIPRNHDVESMIAACIENKDTDILEAYVDVLRSPYTVQQNTHCYQKPPPGGDNGYRTFCGT